ncbi:MAG: hypothetical protein LBP32_01060, partial [Spirochaetaceae bacterium]|nr:hypothetical protein [Spirochaetaceae bacterium]
MAFFISLGGVFFLVVVWLLIKMGRLNRETRRYTGDIKRLEERIRRLEAGNPGLFAEGGEETREKPPGGAFREDPAEAGAVPGAGIPAGEVPSSGVSGEIPGRAGDTGTPPAAPDPGATPGPPGLWDSLLAFI